VQFLGDPKEILMLAVDAGDIHTVAIVPIKHTGQIGISRGKL